MFDKHLVHALIGGKNLDRRSAQSRVKWSALSRVKLSTKSRVNLSSLNL